MVIQPLKIKSDFYQGWHFSNLEPPSSEIARRRHVILKYVSRIPFYNYPTDMMVKRAYISELFP